MALQLGALRDALLDAGAKPDKADRAAEEMAGYADEFASIRTEFAVVRGELGLLKCMLATTLGLVLAVALKLFIH